MIYTPREDSFLLEKLVKKYAPKKKVLDIGCGSGIQMEAALKFGAKEVSGVDIYSESVEFCKKKGLNVKKSDLFGKAKGKFDLIIFNPPYLPEDEREDSESAKTTSGGKKGDEIIIRFLKEAGNYLEKNGKILLAVSSLTPLETIEKVLKNKKMKKRIIASENFFMEKIYVLDIRKS